MFLFFVSLVVCFLLDSAVGWKNQCSVRSGGSLQFDFWANGNAVDKWKTVTFTADGRKQLVPDQCENGFEAFDGRCYAYSLGLFGAPTSPTYGGLGNPSQAQWRTAEDICNSYSHDAGTVGCHLASVHTLRENCFLYEIIKGHYYFYDTTPTPSPRPAYLHLDGHSYNDRNGCHSNNRGQADTTNDMGTCWIGLDQREGSEDNSITYGWSDGTVYDRRPQRNGGFTLWAGAESAKDCWNPVTGNMDYPCSPKPYFEPNNVYPGDEDCTQIWDRFVQGTYSQGEWNDEPCTFSYPYFCAKPARCQKGYFMSIPYKGRPVRIDPSIKDWGVISTDYSMGLCTECPAGTYMDVEGFEPTCPNCVAGVYGHPGETKSTCRAPCPIGSFCPTGTGVNAIQPCPAGTYNDQTGRSSENQCKTTPAGYFTNPNATSYSTNPCPPGRCGEEKRGHYGCDRLCPAGYRCPSGGSRCLDALTTVPSAAPLPQACGSNTQFSAEGASSCTTVTPGYYTSGGTSTTRTRQDPCPPGHYCVGGVLNACPSGTYNALPERQSQSDCLPCAAGYFCPEGSTSATQEPCFRAFPDPNELNKPKMYYCPEATPERKVVDEGYYTIPISDVLSNTRTGQLPCNSSQLCIDGEVFNKIEWSDTSCSSLAVEENKETDLDVRILDGELHDSIKEVYNVTYELVSFTLASDLMATLANGPCDPTTNPVPYSNAGIFALSSDGILSLTRSEYPYYLNYEPVNADGVKCDVSGVRYELKVVATLDDPPATQISCTIPVTVIDKNDNPRWNLEMGLDIYYRTIPERSVINTAVERCSSAASEYGCPVVHPEDAKVEVEATDEDYFSVLRYSIVPDQGSAKNYTDEADNPFRINSCSGLLSMRGDREISYLETKVFNFTIRVEDDGNGGQFQKRTADIIVIIFITDAPDPPTLEPDTYNFEVKENEPYGQLIGRVYATDPDIGAEISYRIENPNDGDAIYFYMEDDYIYTSPLGASTIDFESTKTTYILSITAIDNTGLTDTKQYAIQVINTNDPPRFVDVAPFYILEHSAEHSNVCFDSSGVCPEPGDLDRVQTYDVDGGENDETFYEIITEGSPFEIDDSTGQIRTKTGTQDLLNFEDEAFNDLSGTGRSFKVTVRATSTGNGSPATNDQVYTIYLVDKNENPVITNIPIFFVLETAPVGSACDPMNLELPALTATDPDNADITLKGVLAPMQTVLFSRVDGENHEFYSDGGALFSVFNLPAGGAAIQTLAPLDYETAPMGGDDCGVEDDPDARCYIIRVRARDNGPSPAGTAETWVIIRVVDVNDAPKFNAPFIRTISVREDLAPDEAQISISPASYTAEDQDDSNLSYSIVSGSGLNYFYLEQLDEGCSGSASCFSVYKKEGVTFNFESSEKSFSLEVQVTDSKSSKFIGQGCGEVNNVPTGCDEGTRCVLKQGPFRNEYRCYEYCRPTSEVATGIPRRDTYFCDYTQLEGSQVPIGPEFHQRGDQLLQLRIVVTDYNDPPYIVSDDGTANGVDCLVNRSVVFSKQNTPQVAATELRVIDVDVTYAAAPFTFQKTNDIDEFWQTFDLNSSTGRISITPDVDEETNQNTNKFLELGQVFTAEVTVLDHFPHTPAAPQMSSTCTIVVVVIAENARPNFNDPPPAQVYEGTEAGYVVYATLAENFADIDPDVNGNPPDNLTFSMSESPFFRLNSETSELVLDTTPLNYESLKNDDYKITLVVKVQDSKGADDVATVIIEVLDRNEAPEWSSPTLSFGVLENATAGTLVSDLKLSATDPDEEADGINTFKNTSFTILSGCGACPFELQSPSTSGLLVVKTGQTLDFESANKAWTLVIRATDGGDPSLYQDATVHISLIDVNERPNIATNQHFNVAEGSSGTFLTDLAQLVSDPDASDTIDKLQINITSGDDDGVFTIIAAKLYVSSSQTLDFEKKRDYNLGITVTDAGGLSSTGSFQVTVTNVNDVTITNVALVSGSTLNCNATTKVKLTGTNFGMVTHAPATTTIAVTYQRKPSNADPSPPVLSASNCLVTSADNTEVECDVPAGAGANLRFSISITVTGLISGDSFQNFETSLRYGAPTLTSVTGADSLPTSASSTNVQLIGTCFGTAATNVIFGSNLASSASYIEFCDFTSCRALVGCTVSSPTTIQCTNIIPPGLGSGLKWRVRILGQTTSQRTQGAYARPTLTSSSVTTVPTNGEPASPYFVILGTNFGPLNSVPDAAYFVYLSKTYNLKTCKVTVAYTRVVCQSSDPGVGINMRMYISFGNQLSDQSPFTLNFAQPTVLNIGGVGASDASTLGGQFVTLTGTNFGPICGLPGASIDAGGVHCNVLTATYTRHSVSTSTGLEIVYTAFPCAVVSQTQIVCATAPGTGAGHTWTLILGGQSATVSPTAGTTSYGAPVVATYEGEGAKLAETNGGQLIRIQGSNFGPVGGALVQGLYGNKDVNPTEFTSPNCIVTTAHEVITCELAQGAGKELSWVVIVDGTLGRSELTNYGKPQLTGTTFNTLTYLNNDGNNLISITGLNFGPPDSPGPYLQSASFGPVSFPNAYPADCEVESHTSMTCTLGAGTGSNLRLVVTVKGQQSDPSSFALSYQPPELDAVTGFLPADFPKRTEGGATLFVKGKGFSLCDPKSSIKILWNEDSSVSGATNRVLDITGTFDATGETANPQCPIGQDAQVSFVLPEMNVARRVSARVQVTTSAYGGVFRSNTLTFLYDPPVLSSIFAEASAVNPGGVRVTMFGNNFCKSESCCRTYLDLVEVPSESVVSHAHTRIVLELTHPGELFVRCNCPSGCGANCPSQCVSSNALSFTTNSPFVFGTVPQLDSFEFDPVGGQTFEIWGLYFGDSTPNVTLADNHTLEVLNHAAADCYDLNRPATANSFAFDSGAQCYKTIVRTPPLTGRRLPVVVVRGVTASLADDNRFEFLYYKLPVIVTPSGGALSAALPTSGGGQQLSLEGHHFGVQTGKIVIGDPLDPVTCAIDSWSDEKVVCTVGAGEGFDLPILVVQESGDSVLAEESINIDFLKPSNVNFDDAIAHETQGGTIFEVVGQNFGRPNKATVTVGDRTCNRVFSNSTYVKCTFPEGEGTNLMVTVTVAGQSETSTKRAKYAPPEIISVSPSTDLPTSGGMEFRVVGKNFGWNQIKLFFDNFIVAERFKDPNPALTKDPFSPGTNHTSLVITMPPFFGSNRVVSVSVRNQRSISTQNISFAAPEIGNVSVLQEDGSFSAPFFTSTELIFPESAFNESGPGLPSLNRRRRRLDTQSYGMWLSTSFGPCESNVRARNLFWRSFTEIAPNGEIRRTFNHFSDGQCISTSNQSFVVRVEGKITDLGPFSGDAPTAACGLSRLYSDLTASVTITILTADALDMFYSRCTCVDNWQVGVPLSVAQTCLSSTSLCPLLAQLYGTEYPPGVKRYGVYVVSNDVDIYLSKTSATQAQLEQRSALKFPDLPTASVNAEIANLVNNIPRGPTDGCFQWEPLRQYLERAEAISKSLGIPIGDIPRECFERALMEISGSNFGAPLTPEQLQEAGPDAPPSLRVFLVPDDPDIEPFEASTISSPGSHGILCPEPDCFQTHKKIRFWIPYGLGKSLRIRVHVGDQSQNATTRFSYLPPRIEELSPGTVRRGRSFQNALGELVTVRGFNFGGRSTPTNVLISGRPCTGAKWEPGTATDADGRPFITCNATLDVVGPKSVMICIAGQLSFEKLFRTDGPVLLAGDAIGAWNSSKPFAPEYAGQLKSMTLSRCPQGTTGRLYELCVACPPGAQCEDGSFSGPKSDRFFFDYVVPTRNEDGSISDRARQLCTPESWNETLLEEYPDLVQRETCNAFVGCEPRTACIGNSACEVGYEYAIHMCLEKRGYQNESAFLQITRESVEGTPNSCNVTLNPYTFEYEGVDEDCRGGLPAGSACSSDDPEHCSKCTVFKDGEYSYFGVCECTLPARCSLCTIHSHFRLNNECVPCPENPGLLIGGLFAVAFAVAVLGWYLQREHVNLAFITIGIDYFQVLAIFAATKVPWPPALQSLFNIMSVFNFNIDITAPECITPNLDYEVKWWLQMALPLALFGILTVIYFGYAAVKICRWGIYQPHVYKSHLSALIAIFIVAMYYMYLVLTKKSLEIFNCNPVDPDDGFLYTAFTSLHCDGGGLCRCGEPGGPQERMVPFAIVFLVLYTFGYPAYIAWTLKRNSLLVREDQYLRAYEVGYVRKTNPDCYDMRKRYSKLYYQFKPRYASFWILVLLVRKFWIAFAFILFRGNPSFQLAVVLLVLFTSIVFQVLWRPYLSTGDRPAVIRELDAMAERSIKEPAFAQYREIQKRVNECMTLDVEHRRRQKQNKQGAQLFSGANTEDSGKNLGMSLVNKPKVKVSRSVAAARWFTNLNTLEFILLGCGILVCLAGIMFEASARDNRSLVRAQVDAITYIVLIVVIFSLIYYFIFFLAEVSPAAMHTVISLCKKKEEDPNAEYYDPNINLEENPMFAAPKVEFADNRALQSELDQQLAQLKIAEQQNKKLREELKNKKMEAQLDETAKTKLAGLEDQKPTKQRKDFAQTRLNAALVGPNRQRARGAKKVQEEEEEEEDVEAANSNRMSVFKRMSIFRRPNKMDDGQ